MKTFVVVIGLSVAACSAPPRAELTVDAGQIVAPIVADGPTLVAASCSACHSAELVRQQRLTPAQWEKVVKKMVGWGAPVDPSEASALVAHLASTYGPDAGPYEVASVSPTVAAAELEPLPDGAFALGDAERGKALFATRCAACHGADARGQLGVNLVDRPLLSRAADVARKVRTGSGRMPAQPTTTDAEVADLLAHLRSIRTGSTSPAGASP